MSTVYRDGIPTVREYRRSLASDTFRRVEIASERFLSAHRDILTDYAERWVADPLHQWSRQWEYPYVADRIEEALGERGGRRLLDAGSGVTFFPYHLSASRHDAQVCCCDLDDELGSLFERINSCSEHEVDFTPADLRALPYADASFDVVYCISVLEHTNDYREIVGQFQRVLRPGGLLVVTFDVSLDGTRDIDIDGGTELLRALTEKFVRLSDVSADMRSHVSQDGILTTIAAHELEPSLLPWKPPSWLGRIRRLVTKGRGSSRWPPPLTVFGIGLQRV